MPNGMRWAGLDVHAHASAVEVFDDGTGEVISRRVSGRPIEVLDLLRELPRPLRAVYEAGPTRYGLVRRARTEGIGRRSVRPAASSAGRAIGSRPTSATRSPERSSFAR
jgi:hypothetical protein